MAAPELDVAVIGGGVVGAAVAHALEDAASRLRSERTIEPRSGEAQRRAARERWRPFVEASAAL